MEKYLLGMLHARKPNLRIAIPGTITHTKELCAARWEALNGPMEPGSTGDSVISAGQTIGSSHACVPAHNPSKPVEQQSESISFVNGVSSTTKDAAPMGFTKFTPDQLHELSTDKLSDAKTLLESRRYAACHYLCGYALELALKRRIA